jgi:hypothetical protein
MGRGYAYAAPTNRAAWIARSRMGRPPSEGECQTRWRPSPLSEAERRAMVLLRSWLIGPDSASLTSGRSANRSEGLLAYRHGLRAAEACDLRWDQVDFAGAGSTSGGSRTAPTSTHPIQGDETPAAFYHTGTVAWARARISKKGIRRCSRTAESTCRRIVWTLLCCPRSKVGRLPPMPPVEHCRARDREPMREHAGWFRTDFVAAPGAIGA